MIGAGGSSEGKSEVEGVTVGIVGGGGGGGGFLRKKIRDWINRGDR